MSTHDPIYLAFLENVRRARLNAGLSQAAVADALTRPQSFIAKIEAGERRLDVAEAMRLAAVLGTSLQALLPNVDSSNLARPTPHRLRSF